MDKNQIFQLNDITKKDKTEYPIKIAIKIRNGQKM